MANSTKGLVRANDDAPAFGALSRESHRLSGGARLNAAILLVSTTSRETRPGGDETIGIHRDRRQPSSLGRGNPGRLVLAQESWKSKRPAGNRDLAGPVEESSSSEDEERASREEE